MQTRVNGTLRVAKLRKALDRGIITEREYARALTKTDTRLVVMGYLLLALAALAVVLGIVVVTAHCLTLFPLPLVVQVGLITAIAATWTHLLVGGVFASLERTIDRLSGCETDAE